VEKRNFVLAIDILSFLRPSTEACTMHRDIRCCCVPA
jgi:hypothetical protein